MDRAIIVGIIGKRGHGKTTLVHELTADAPRVLFWDWRNEGEYDGELVELAGLPAMLRRPAFRAVIKPHRAYTLASYFNAVCSVIMDCGKSFIFSVDEAANVVHRGQEGGLGLLLRCSRPSAVSVLWATQRPCGIPTTWLSECDLLYLFRLQHTIDLRALRGLVSPADLAALPGLRRFECLRITL